MGAGHGGEKSARARIFAIRGGIRNVGGRKIYAHIEDRTIIASRIRIPELEEICREFSGENIKFGSNRLHAE